MHKRRFTLIELLIVIAIIAILAGMLLPALAQVKKISQKIVCVNNQKQIITMMASYCSSYNDYIAPNTLVKVYPEASGSGVTGIYLLLKHAGLLNTDGITVGNGTQVPNPKIIWCPSKNSPADERPNAISSMRQTICIRTLGGQYMTGTSFYHGAGYHIAGGYVHYPPGDAHKNEGLYMTKVKHPSGKAYLAEMGDAQIVAGGGAFAAGKERITRYYSELPECLEDFANGRHMKKINLAFLDGHISSMDSEKVQKNFDANTWRDITAAEKIIGGQYYNF